MNLIAKYLEKDPDNAEIELPTFGAQTSRLERLQGRRQRGCRAALQPFFSEISKKSQGYPLDKIKIWKPKSQLAALFVLGSPFKKFLATPLDYAKTVHNAERRQRGSILYNVTSEEDY